LICRKVFVERSDQSYASLHTFTSRSLDHNQRLRIEQHSAQGDPAQARSCSSCKAVRLSASDN
jgi:adenosyl cobinamide kinase/adenosyl cobinamide phosphate guanylyltransferase